MDICQGDEAHHEALRLLTRRQILKGGLGGGLFLGLAGLGGCKSAPQSRGANPGWSPSAGPVCIMPPENVPPVRVPANPGSIAVMPRSAWAGGGPHKSVIHDMNGIGRITIHHDGCNTFTSASQSDAARRIEGIREAHLQRKARGTGENWGDIGYHYVVDPGGRVWEGRDVRFQGAHVQDQNEHNLGIMMLGNYDGQTPTPAARAAIAGFLASQMRRYRVNIAKVRTHRELAATECPGTSLQAYMNQIRSRGGQLAMVASEMGLA